MNIQIIYFGIKKDYGNEYDYEYSSLESPNSLDMYDVNIIDLSSDELWINENNSYNYSGINYELIIDRISDFDSLKLVLEQSKKAKNIIFLPQNVKYFWNSLSGGHFYRKSIVLKDLILEFIKLLKIHLIPSWFSDKWSLLFENTITECLTTNYNAAFSFISPTTIMTTCKGGGNATTICSKNCIITTLDLQNHIRDFLKAIKLDNQEDPVPGWVKSYNFYNDEEQQKIITDNNKEIKLLEKQNADAREKLS